MTNFKKFSSMVLSMALIANASAVAVSAAPTVTYKYGDVNLNGVVDEQDSELLRDALWGRIQLTEVQRTVADVDGDLHVNYNDYSALNAAIADGDELGTAEFAADDSGKVLHFIGSSLSVNSTGWMASVENTASDSLFNLTEWYMDAHSNGSSMFLNPYNAEINGSDSKITYSEYMAKADLSYGSESVSAYASKYGQVSFLNTYLDKARPAVRKASRTAKNLSENDPMFGATDYSIGGTVNLLNASVTRYEDGFEFINNMSDYYGTSTAFLNQHYCTMDGVTVSYDPETDTFSYDNIDPETIEIENRDVRYTYNGKGIIGFEEYLIVTDDTIYAAMYDPEFDWLAALVKCDRATNECILAQYNPASDRATISTHYVLDEAVEEGLENPDVLVGNLDERYDPDNMVFQTVMYKNKMKVSLIGASTPANSLANGMTIIQLSNGLNNVTVADTSINAGVAMTFGNMYGNKMLQLTTPSDGVQTFAGSYNFTVGNDTFGFKGSMYNPDGTATYKSGDISESFTVKDVLGMRTASMY